MRGFFFVFPRAQIICGKNNGVFCLGRKEQFAFDVLGTVNPPANQKKISSRLGTQNCWAKRLLERDTTRKILTLTFFNVNFFG